MISVKSYILPTIKKAIMPATILNQKTNICFGNFNTGN